jgi:multidrug efflux pump subunit AcrB
MMRATRSSAFAPICLQISPNRSIQRIDAASQPIGYYAFEGEGMTPQDISWFIDNDLQRELLAVPGVSASHAHRRRRS